MGPPATTVVNLKGRVHENEGRRPAGGGDIGRHVRRGGWALDASEWRNRFGPKDGTPEERVGSFLTWLHCTEEGVALGARVGEARGEALGCWCVPDLCHGDVLAASRRRSGDGAGHFVRPPQLQPPLSGPRAGGSP